MYYRQRNEQLSQKIITRKSKCNPNSNYYARVYALYWSILLKYMPRTLHQCIAHQPVILHHDLVEPRLGSHYPKFIYLASGQTQIDEFVDTTCQVNKYVRNKQANGNI